MRIEWTIMGWSGPIFCRRSWTTSVINWIAWLLLSWLQKLDAIFFIISTYPDAQVPILPFSWAWFTPHLFCLLPPALFPVCWWKISYTVQRFLMLKPQHPISYLADFEKCSSRGVFIAQICQQYKKNRGNLYHSLQSLSSPLLWLLETNSSIVSSHASAYTITSPIIQ